jgi:hypothetical protein
MKKRSFGVLCLVSAIASAANAAGDVAGLLAADLDGRPIVFMTPSTESESPRFWFASRGGEVFSAQLPAELADRLGRLDLPQTDDLGSNQGNAAANADRVARRQGGHSFGGPSPRDLGGNSGEPGDGGGVPTIPLPTPGLLAAVGLGLVAAAARSRRPR